MSRVRIALAALTLGMIVGFGVGWSLGGGDAQPSGRLSDDPDVVEALAPANDQFEASEAETSAGPSDAASSTSRNRRGGHPAPKRSVELDARVRARFAAEIEAAWRQAHEEEIPADQLTAAVDAAVTRHNELSAGLLPDFRQHEERRRRLGEIAEPVDLVLEMRTRWRRAVTLVSDPEENPNVHKKWSDEPLDADTPLGADDRSLARVVGGVIPPGKVLVLERIDLTSHAGYRQRGGQVGMRLGGTPIVENSSFRGRLKGSFAGRVIVRAREEHRVELRAKDAAVRVRLRGRLVSEDQAYEPSPEPMRLMQDEEREGFLEGGTVLLQMYAEHGGGNPHTVYLDGGNNGYVDDVTDTDIWQAGRLDGRGDSVYRAHGSGLVPPGRELEIYRVDYRARLSPENGSSSDFSLQIGSEKLIDTDAKKEAAPEGTWVGSVRIRPGRERGVYLTTSYYAVGEARIYTRLVKEEEAPEDE